MRHKNSPDACLQFVLGQVRTNSELSWLPAALNDPSLKNWGRIFSFFAGKPDLRELAEAVAPLFDVFDWDDELRVLPVKPLIDFTVRAKERGDPEPYDIELCNLLVRTMNVGGWDHIEAFAGPWLAQTSQLRILELSLFGLEPREIVPHVMTQLRVLKLWGVTYPWLDWLGNATLPELRTIVISTVSPGQRLAFPRFAFNELPSVEDLFRVLDSTDLCLQLVDVHVGSFSRRTLPAIFDFEARRWPRLERLASKVDACPVEQLVELPRLRYFESLSYNPYSSSEPFINLSLGEFSIHELPATSDLLETLNSRIDSLNLLHVSPEIDWFKANRHLTFDHLESLILSFEGRSEDYVDVVLDFFSDTERCPNLKMIELASNSEIFLPKLCVFRDIEELDLNFQYVSLRELKVILDGSMFSKLKRLRISSQRLHASIPDDRAFESVRELDELTVDILLDLIDNGFFKWLLSDAVKIKARRFSLESMDGFSDCFSEICNKLEVRHLVSKLTHVRPKDFSSSVPGIEKISSYQRSFKNFRTLVQSENLPNLVVID